MHRHKRLVSEKMDETPFLAVVLKGAWSKVTAETWPWKSLDKFTAIQKK
jgi:hypothetical protein